MKRFAFIVEIACDLVVLSLVVLELRGLVLPRWGYAAQACFGALYSAYLFGIGQRLRGTWIERCWNFIVVLVSGALGAIHRCAWRLL